VIAWGLTGFGGRLSGRQILRRLLQILLATFVVLAITREARAAVVGPVSCINRLSQLSKEVRSRGEETELCEMNVNRIKHISIFYFAEQEIEANIKTGPFRERDSHTASTYFSCLLRPKYGSRGHAKFSKVWWVQSLGNRDVTRVPDILVGILASCAQNKVYRRSVAAVFQVEPHGPYRRHGWQSFEEGGFKIHPSCHHECTLNAGQRLFIDLVCLNSGSDKLPCRGIRRGSGICETMGFVRRSSRFLGQLVSNSDGALSLGEGCLHLGQLLLHGRGLVTHQGKLGLYRSIASRPCVLHFSQLSVEDQIGGHPHSYGDQRQNSNDPGGPRRTPRSTIYGAFMLLMGAALLKALLNGGNSPSTPSHS
jgi:hypothetical protein